MYTEKAAMYRLVKCIACYGLQPNDDDEMYSQKEDIVHIRNILCGKEDASFRLTLTLNNELLLAQNKVSRARISVYKQILELLDDPPSAEMPGDSIARLQNLISTAEADEDTLFGVLDSYMRCCLPRSPREDAARDIFATELSVGGTTGVMRTVDAKSLKNIVKCALGELSMSVLVSFHSGNYSLTMLVNP